MAAIIMYIFFAFSTGFGISKNNENLVRAVRDCRKTKFFYNKKAVLPTAFFYLFNSRITFAGLPTASELSGISFVTTAPAPITQPFPMMTPGQITAFPPIQQSLPIVTGFELSMVRLSIASSGCVAV